MILDPLQSVSNFSFYKEVPRKSIGATIGYLAYLGLAFSAALTAVMYVQMRPKIAQAVEWAAVSIPPMTLSGGKLSSQLQAPVLIRHPSVTDAAFIIDTARTEVVSAAEMEQKKVLAYLTQNTIYLLTNQNLQTFDLSKGSNPRPLSIDGEFYRAVGRTLNRVLYPSAFITMWLVFLFWKHMSALLYSLLALLLNAVVSANLDYPELYKLSVYAQTPVVGLQIAGLFFPRPIPFFGILAVLLVGLYLWQGIRQNLRPGTQPA